MSCMSEPVAHILCGLVGSGKTTVAKRIEAEQAAVRFTLDEWAIRIGVVTVEHPDYGLHAERAWALIWDEAAMRVCTGESIVLDRSHWSREQRRDSRDRAVALGARPLLHYIATPIEQTVAQLRSRNQALPPGTHYIDIENMLKFSREFFEPPTSEEGMEIVVETHALYP